MSMTWEVYENKLKAYGETKRDRQLEQAIEDFKREAVGNPAYQKAKRNGVEEEFLITRSDKTERFKITAFPGNDLCIGDYIEVFGEVFLVYQVRAQNTLNKTGIIWQCNHLFRWQNFDSTIIERWGILDSGVYSTTIRGEDDVKYKNKQFKLIFPLDEDTRKIYVDKRIAVDVMYDRKGREVLNVYQVTGYDATGESFGKGGHILYLNIRSDEYNDETDNVAERICDYIDPNKDTPIGEGLPCEIVGSSTIRAGAKRKYSAKFYDIDGNIDTSVIPSWGHSTLPDGITSSIGEDNKITISVKDDVNLIGQEIVLTLTDEEAKYQTAQLTISIISL